jgi:hypothetical protein
LDVGQISYSHNDWAKEDLYYHFIAQSLLRGEIPWRLPIAMQRTDNLLANPEVSLSPAVLALPFVGVPLFQFANFLLAYVIGAFGWLRATRTIQAPLAAAGWLLFALNGHLVAHIAVGHSMWSGILLLPWIAVGLQATRNGPLIVGGTLAAMLLWGTIHPTVWTVATLALAVPLRLLHWTSLLRAVLWFLAFGAMRWLPTALLLGNYTQPSFPGFPNAESIVAALVLRLGYDPGVPATVPIPGLALGWWEYTHFIGWSGTLWVIGLGVVRPLFRAVQARRWTRETSLLGLAAILFSLTLGEVYPTLFALPVPAMSAQRVPMRWMLVVLLIVGWLALKESTSLRLRESWWWALAAVLATELHLNLMDWRPGPIELREALQIPFPTNAPGDPSAFYVSVVVAGWFVSICAAVLAIIRLRSAPPEPPSRKP